MTYLRRHRTALLFAVLLVFCSVMVIHQYNVNRSHHIELREAFILLEAKDYRPQAARLYQRLLGELPKLSDAQLLDDFQRTLTLVDPRHEEPDNLIWKYHRTVSNEFERRSAKALERALKMAAEE